jgi:SET domain-containing protein
MGYLLFKIPDMLTIIDECKEQKQKQLPPGPKGSGLPCPASQPITKPERFFRLERETRYDHISLRNVLLNNYQLDSDVYEYSQDGTLSSVPLISHKQKYITNSSFDTLTHLNNYLREQGKIPVFLEIRESAKKGLGVFATKPISAGTFLGYYEGINRMSHNSLYGCRLIGFDGTPHGTVDGDNILFSNFTRWINDGKTPNISHSQMHYQVLIHTLTDISEGEELLGNYGNSYFSAHGIVRVD